MSKTFLLVLGTRPEAIKLAPVHSALCRRFGSDNVKLLATGQHPDLARLALQDFDIAIDLCLEAPSAGGLSARSAWMLDRLGGLMDDAVHSHVVVQGDTSTAFMGALAAFNARIPVVHVEAGLRTYDLAAPFPEEANRRLIAPLADICFAPTERAAENLRSERIPAQRIEVVGNTVVDAIEQLRPRFEGAWPAAAPGVRRIAVTLHRREAWGAPLQALCEGLAGLCRRRSDVDLVLPVHPNPMVGDIVRTAFAGVPNAELVEPLGFVAMQSLLSTSTLLVTDSGGLQEEAPSHGVPVLVTREVTERVEAVEAGTARLVGLDATRLVAAAEDLLDNEAARRAMVRDGNPFGDGHAAERIAARLATDRAEAA
ncbi:non-hydrolyzing UDP-N-acetylglucosamine 2-epimerase [Marinibaculum pumilum]|uniref:UDP-N-acetylglucosamine 2-epimerase (non-hydrolyzing) n=1 Tax=Marinibaculum pumilum TaxID=1766165 RepID=A0ABV7L1B3_9PROT